jgi:PUB domain
MESIGEIPQHSETGTFQISQWLGRALFTVFLAVIYHFWCNRKWLSFRHTGYRLEDDSSSTVEVSLSQKRLAFLDALEGKSPTPLLFDDIEEDEEKDSMHGESLLYDDIDQSSSEEGSQDESPKNDIVESDEISMDVALVSEETSSPNLQGRPCMQGADCEHPGLDGFLRWYENEASLYRIYTVGRKDKTEVYPPFVTKSERGQVSLKLHVTNNYFKAISVFWIDYKGIEVLKGTMKHGGIFQQLTWIGHPWTFREKDTGKLLCHYIPYKVIATSHEVPTIDPEDPTVGMHRFAIVSLGQRPQVTFDDEHVICAIADPVFPTRIETIRDAAAWSFQEMSRRNYPSLETLVKYFTNIVMRPANIKYRQIRIAQTRFFNEVWNTPARGLLLAAGFVENGAYVEMGNDQSLPRERVQELSTMLFYMEKWKRIQDLPPSVHSQPEGADGFGRANYSRRI